MPPLSMRGFCHTGKAATAAAAALQQVATLRLHQNQAHSSRMQHVPQQKTDATHSEDLGSGRRHLRDFQPHVINLPLGYRIPRPGAAAGGRVLGRRLGRQQQARGCIVYFTGVPASAPGMICSPCSLTR